MSAEKPDYTRRQIAKRCVLLAAALYIMTIGISMSKLAGLGTTPISCIPATLSYSTPLSMGAWTVIFNFLLICIEAAVLGRQFRPVQFMQLIMAAAIGIFTDINLEVFSFIDPGSYAESWAWCILSGAILGLGVMLEVRSNILVAPGEGVVVAFTTRFKVPFPRMKIVSDTSMVITAVILSLAMLGDLEGVREGTIFAALTVGIWVGFFRKHLGKAADRFTA
ncbi:hypothetical protein AUQ37_08415 [Candidatus Methanomethylophilus sp. 1R26]|uniref:YczE/YyaS/YitT family protein n=1 Tax=Candidatus Methanomethylophilus sp. 1R26 TaxID=1769296 RepID=UPI0007372D33|nr:DUF6198 family protein [Candidatus Methanomethylophilus sp. 1R26]KUE73671.1 hypothetical protein AUQ37_08415 [Candidatus Methanomethylophilus sp. 1R26]